MPPPPIASAGLTSSHSAALAATAQQRARAIAKRETEADRAAVARVRESRLVDTMFTALDRDGSGTISASEIEAMMAQIGVSATHDEIAAMLAEVDEDGSGEVDREEFATVMGRRVRREDVPYSTAEVKAAFELLARVPPVAATASARPAASGLISAADLRRTVLIYGAAASRLKAAAREKEKEKEKPGVGKARDKGKGKGGAAGSERPPVTAERADAIVLQMEPDAAGDVDWRAYLLLMMGGE